MHRPARGWKAAINLIDVPGFDRTAGLGHATCHATTPRLLLPKNQHPPTTTFKTTNKVPKRSCASETYPAVAIYSSRPVLDDFHFPTQGLVLSKGRISRRWVPCSPSRSWRCPALRLSVACSSALLWPLHTTVVLLPYADSLFVFSSCPLLPAAAGRQRARWCVVHAESAATGTACSSDSTLLRSPLPHWGNSSANLIIKKASPRALHTPSYYSSTRYCRGSCSLPGPSRNYNLSPSTTSK